MQDLTKGAEGPLILRFMIPMLIGNLFQQFYNMVDSWVVGNFVGREALAAVGASFPVIFLMIALMTGLTMGANILIAQAYGAKQMGKVRSIIDTTYIALILTGIVLSIGGVLWTLPLLRMLRVPPEVLDPAASYLRVIFGGSLLMLGYNGVSSILRGLGDSKTPLYMLMAATVLNICLDLLFVFRFHWGTKGVAWATVISQGVSVIGSILYLNRTHPVLRTNFTRLTFDPSLFRLSLKIGLPTGGQQVLVSLGMMFMVAIVNGFGTAVIAGFTAASRIDSLAALPSMNIGLAVSSFTGQNLGAARPDRVKAGYRAALGIGTTLVGTMILLFLLFSRELIGLFSQDPEVIRYGVEYLRIIAPFHLVFMLMFLTNGVIRGAGAVLVPFLTTLLAMWLIRVPVAALFSRLWGVPGIFWSIPTGWVVGTAISVLYYRSGRWAGKVLIRRGNV